MIFNVNPDAMTKILSNLLSNASNYAEQEALRQFGVFNTPIPVPPPERKLDKMKEAPDPARSLEREER